MKWLARRAVKAPLVTRSIVRQALRKPEAPRGCSILIYHRVNGGLGLELDLAPELFSRQIELLSATSRVVAFEDALEALNRSSPLPQSSIVLTFDDGYVDFYTRVFPLLRKHNLPAILYVTTGFVEDGTPYPMVSNPHLDVEPVTWEMLGEMVESGLVSVGAHTHTHPVMNGLPCDRVEEELVRPLDLFERRLGMRPRHFAYPRGMVTPAVRELVARYYASAVAGGGRRATPEHLDRYEIPRIPIRRSDGWQFFRAKLNGWLDDEEPMYAWLRQLAGRSAA